ncbi:MAG: hypothetical protein MUF22_08920 [Chitinispirillaceae bacterium]|nr:hypothetical protein [Chitinispirillaceae bacterium]
MGSSQRGGVGVRVMWVMATLLVMSVLIWFVLEEYPQRQQENNRKAETISLYGMQTALEQLGADPEWDKGFEKVPYDAGWYSVSLHRTTDNGKVLLTIKSEGHKGSSSYVKEYLLERTAESGWRMR